MPEGTRVMAQAPQCLSEFLYRVSLEAPGSWFMIIGTGLETDPPYLNIGNLRSFVLGYEAGARTESSRDGFFEWLRDEANAFPSEGWARHLLTISWRKSPRSHSFILRAVAPLSVGNAPLVVRSLQ